MIDYSKQTCESEEVFLSKTGSAVLNDTSVYDLIELAKKSKRRKVRFCAHSNPEDQVHEMFIVHEKGTYVRPHKHCYKAESLLVIEGSLDYIVFDDLGGIKKKFSMSDFKSGKSFYHKIPPGVFHSIVIHSDWLVFMEVTQGPFKAVDSEFARWSPEDREENNEEICNYVQGLLLG